MAGRIRLIAGAVIWLGIIGWFGWRCSGWFAGGDQSAGNQLSRFLFHSEIRRDLKFHGKYYAEIGEPIFWRDTDGELIQVGMIRQIESPQSQNHLVGLTDWASASFFSNAPKLGKSHYLKMYETPQTMAWVAQVLLPKEKLIEVRDHIASVLESKAPFLSTRLKPVLLKAIRETISLVLDSLAESASERSDEWAELGRRYQVEIVDNELIPLLDKQVWPVIQEELVPVIESIGAEIWSKAPVWGIGWRAIYDSLPLTNSTLARKEFDAFLREVAMPVVASRSGELLAAQKRVLSRVVDSPEVRQFVRRTFERLAEDNELQTLIARIIRESIIENEQLLARLDEIWSSPEIRETMELTDQELGAEVEKIGQMIFGSPLGGVTPEFARILRRKILLKDMRWYLLVTSDDEPSTEISSMGKMESQTLPVVFAWHSEENPFYIEARSRK
jgi:hypothetical protein